MIIWFTIFFLFNSQPKEEPDDSPQMEEANDDPSNSADIQDPANYQEVFRTRNRLGMHTNPQLCQKSMRALCQRCKYQFDGSLLLHDFSI